MVCWKELWFLAFSVTWFFFCLVNVLLPRWERATNPALCSAKASQVLPICESSIWFVGEELLVAVLLRTRDLMVKEVWRVYGISPGVARSEFED